VEDVFNGGVCMICFGCKNEINFVIKTSSEFVQIADSKNILVGSNTPNVLYKCPICRQILANGNKEMETIANYERNEYNI
jgi:hypothetical protein